MAVTKIFDSVDGEIGADYTNYDRELATKVFWRIQFVLASGDTLVLDGKLDSAADYSHIGTISQSDYTTGTIETMLPIPVLRVRRTVDGGVGDSQVYVQEIQSF